MERIKLQTNINSQIILFVNNVSERYRKLTIKIVWKLMLICNFFLIMKQKYIIRIRMIVSYPKKRKAMIVYCDFINAEAELFCVNTLWRVEYVIILIRSTFPPNEGSLQFFLDKKSKTYN